MPEPTQDPTRAHGTFVGAGSIEDVLETAETPPELRADSDLALLEDRVETAEVPRPLAKTAEVDFGSVDPDVDTVDLRGEVMTADGSATETTPYHTVLPVPGQVLPVETVPPPGPPPGSPVDGDTEPFPAVLPVPGANLPDLLEPGVTVEGVRLGARLRNEALGTVFAAEHPNHGECEVLALSEAAGALLGPHFLRAARLRASLDPSDLRLPLALGFGSKPTPWVASRVRAGAPLIEMLEGDPGRLGRLVLDVAEALAPLHALRLPHGDLTPDDVRVVDGRVRLGGFGRAVYLDKLGVRRPFRGGPASGDAAFLAPEVAEGGEPTPAADVYALGAFLWTGLTGHPPYTGTPKEIREGLTSGPPAPADRPPASRLERALFEVAGRCLERRAAERFRDAGDLALGLQETIARHSVHWGRWLVLLAVVVFAALAAARSFGG